MLRSLDLARSAMFILALSAIITGCTDQSQVSSGQDTLDAQSSPPTQADKVRMSFTVDASSLKSATEGLEPDCLAALEYQNRFERAYLQGKMALLDLMRARGSDGGFKDTKTTTRNPISLTVTVGTRAIDLQTSRDGNTVSEGGSVTAGGGTAGSGGAISVAAPQTTKTGEDTDNVTLEFSAGSTLTVPLSNQVTFTEIPADETTLMTEAIRAFYRMPVYCNIMKKCTGFGIPQQNHDTGGFCGGLSFSMGGGGSGGSGGGGRP